jgi:two-component system, LuxR family, response regulator FixJ
MSNAKTVCIVDDDADVRDSLAMLLQRSGYQTLSFDSARAFLQAGLKGSKHCVLADIRMPEMDGLALQLELKRTQPEVPVLIMTGHGDIPMAVQAMKAGAIDFLEKPFEKPALLAALERAFAVQSRGVAGDQKISYHKRQELTERERAVFDLLVEGLQNKVIAHKLGISARTVEVHRRRVMEKTGARNLAELVKMALSNRSA